MKRNRCFLALNMLIAILLAGCAKPVADATLASATSKPVEMAQSDPFERATIPIFHVQKMEYDTPYELDWDGDGKTETVTLAARYEDSAYSYQFVCGLTMEIAWADGTKTTLDGAAEEGYDRSSAFFAYLLDTQMGRVSLPDLTRVRMIT